MVKSYNFCFIFNKIIVTSSIIDHIDIFSMFKFKITKDGIPIGETRPIECIFNDDRQINIDQEKYKIIIPKYNPFILENCEIQLLQMHENNKISELGRYEFLLNNYLTAYNQLRHICIEMAVQISEQFTIIYDVYIEHTPQALAKIIYENQAYKMLNNSIQDQSEIVFSLEYSQFAQSNQFYIKQLGSPIINTKHYYSPLRKNNNHYLNKALLNQTKIIFKNLSAQTQIISITWLVRDYLKLREQIISTVIFKVQKKEKIYSKRCRQSGINIQLKQ